MSNGFFGKKLAKKSKTEKVNIIIIFYMFKILETKCQLQLRILNFWTTFTQKDIFDLKRNKRKIIIEFYISELA